jgi:hypothetical protein
MTEYVHLVGTEDVQRAASNMQHSAEEFNRAAGYIDESLSRFLERFEELVIRLENIGEKND